MNLKRKTIVFLVAATLATGSLSAMAEGYERFKQDNLAEGESLPTGVRITPTAAYGAVFDKLNPDLTMRPDYTAGQAVATSVSPDGNTLLVLTSGFNRLNDWSGKQIANESNEYVFVYDISTGVPNKTQVIQVANTFNGIAWNPNGNAFYVTGGVDDNVHVYGLQYGAWQESGGPIPLGHNNTGLGIRVRPMATGVAVTADGNRLLVANFENDSASLIDLSARAKIAEIELRPGKVNAAKKGVAGGEFPFAVSIKGNAKAYLSSMRDREVVVVDLQSPQPSVIGRIAVGGQPNKMLLDAAQRRLFVANGNSDSVSVIDTATDKVIEQFGVTAPRSLFPNPKKFKGANPNSLALTADEKFLLVTNGGTNSVAVVRLAGSQVAKNETYEGDNDEAKSRVIGLIPTGWYPNSVSISKNGAYLYVVNGKSNTGPNLGACRNTLSIASGSLNGCNGKNQYVWQLTKAGFLSMPMPNEKELARLTWQVAKNNNFPGTVEYEKARETMDFVRSKIKHVIYVVKENRTYDQVLGDLEKGNGDPSLTLFPEPITPNHHALARKFVTLDNFYDSGSTSNDGWNWTTAARTTDFTEKTIAVNYAGRGLTYDWEGSNRNINVGLATVEKRKSNNPETPDDPNFLPGTADVAAPDVEGEAGAGYLWDGALSAGLSIRNYGFFVNNLNTVTPTPYADGVIQSVASKQALMAFTDPFFRGYDQTNSDFWLFKEWEREFDQYAQNGNLPNLSFVRLPHDHFGNYSTAISGVNTPETQMADNDYAVGMLIEKVAKSRFKDDTLIFVIEDDAQNGPDHMDAHRSIAYILGPYVRQGALVSERFTTVNMIRTIKDVLGIESRGITDGLALPMSEVFEKIRRPWDYSAIVPEVLRSTQLPLPRKTVLNSLPVTTKSFAFAKPMQDAAYWQTAMQGQDFSVEDNLDEPSFNRSLWYGLKGMQVPYPETRHNNDLTRNRKDLLKQIVGNLQ